MRLTYRWWRRLTAAVLGGLLGVTAAVATANEQFLPVLSIREGALRSMMIPRADGYIAYLTLLKRARWRYQRRQIGLGGM